MYYTMSDLVDMERVPYNIAKHMLWDCPVTVCRKPVLYNEKLTSVKCSNLSCPGHLGKRAEAMFQTLNYTGLGYSFAENLIINYGLKHHLDLFNKDFIDRLPDNSEKHLLFKRYTNNPVSIDFYKIFTFLYIPQIQEQWYDIIGTATTVEEVINKPEPINLSKVQWIATHS